ncbi:MAG: low molecular weight protein arginine phosphatase [Clostridiales bacterium]|nr:low molecular weight protein arginine phosphatase [Clostridiales bacterium]
MTILFVCTGNTCRSPMAACMMENLCRQHGVSEIRCLSAGVDAWDGQPASSGAQHAMQQRGLSLATHRSQTVTQELLNQTDLVFCVSPRHRDALQYRFAPVPPIHCFQPAIPDPFGGSDAEYELCAAAMEQQLKAFVQQLGHQA